MYIPRDITNQLEFPSTGIQILLGPRQCGKSTLFASLMSKDNHFKEITFDDLHLRQLANQDPALFLEQFEPPLLLDEVQYVPHLFPELKRKIDELKRMTRLGSGLKQERKVLFRLTGSNQILMDKNVKESLAGRASYYYLNTLTVHEILNAIPQAKIIDILYRGGWPELYAESDIQVTAYLNDYIRTYVEKDILLSAGIQKINEFQTVLGLLAARTGQLLDFSDIAKDVGVSSVTIKEWISLLERADLLYLLRPYSNNLNKRLIKTPKLYFFDTGLGVRLQGWQDPLPLGTSPQIGALFETLVFAEMMKFIRNYRKDWQLFFWRTKEGEEIDFVLKTSRDTVYGFEVKMAIQNLPQTITYPSSFRKAFSPNTPLAIVCFGGRRVRLNSHCIAFPIAELHDYLIELE